LEESELATELLPDSLKPRLVLFYESAEGGAGVLRRLLDDPAAFSRVARQALEVCHFDPDSGDDRRRAERAAEDCEAACYDCLMSYTNQPSHGRLDRQRIKDVLMRWARSRAEVAPGGRTREDHLAELRRLAGWLGVEPGPIVSRVRQSAGRTAGQENRRGKDPGSGGPVDRGRPDPAADRPDRESPETDATGPGPGRPNPADRRSSVEREMVKLVLQQPDLVASGYAQVQAVAFTEPAYLAVHEAVLRAGGPEETGGGAAWVTAVAEQAPAGAVRSLVTELAVEPPKHRSDEPDSRYAGAIVARMAERAAAVEERRLQSALRRAEAEHDRDRAMSLQTDLVKMAAYRRALSNRARGEMV